MNEPRFARMWRRRAFGLRRNAARKAHERAEPGRNGLELLAAALKAAAVKVGFRLGGRRARLRLVLPEQERAPAPVDPAALQSVRLDARGLQRLLEAELLARRPSGPSDEHAGEPERFRRSG
jgi:hypothetical protein